MTAIRTTPLDDLGLHAPGDVNGVLRAHRFPFARDGHFLFLHHDPERRLTGVRLLHGLRGYRHPPVFEERLPGVHVLALPAPGISRMEYRLVLTGPGGTRDVLDPLNRLTVEGVFGRSSVAFGPGAATPLYARPPVPEAAGVMTPVTGPFALDGRGGRISAEAWLWVPPGVAPADPLPLVLVLDGVEYVRFARLRDTIANLVHDGAIAPCRVLFIPPRHRNREYSAHPRFPAVLADAAAAAGAGGSATPVFGVGASLGGLALLHAHVVRPGLFSGLLLQSGSFFTAANDGMESGFAHFERIERCVAPVLSGATAVTPIPVHLTCGAGGENLENNRAMLAALRRQDVPADLALVADAHNWTAWRDCIGPGLEHLLSPAR